MRFSRLTERTVTSNSPTAGEEPAKGGYGIGYGSPAQSYFGEGRDESDRDPGGRAGGAPRAAIGGRREAEGQEGHDRPAAAINDFHGNLEPPPAVVRASRPASDRSAGGAEYLATHLKRLRESSRHSIIVAAGDSSARTPLISGLFHDEPTIESLNAMGLSLSPRRQPRVRRGVRANCGGCRTAAAIRSTAARTATGSAARVFQYLAANVFVHRAPTGRCFPPTAVGRSTGVKVAFIGLTLEGTPQIVTPAGVAGLEFRDEVVTINELVAAAPPRARRPRRGPADSRRRPAARRARRQHGPERLRRLQRRDHDDRQALTRTSRSIVSAVTRHRAYNCTIRRASSSPARRVTAA